MIWYIWGSIHLLISSTFNLLVNNNQKLYICGLDIYGRDIVTHSDASTVTLTGKSQKRPPTQDYDPSLDSPQNVPLEDSWKISVNNNQNRKNQPNILSFPGYKVNQIQNKKDSKNTWEKTGAFCLYTTESETNVNSPFFHNCF